MFARWLSESWKEFFAEGGQNLVKKAFQRCGMLNAVDGSENNLVKVQGIENYTFDSESSSEESSEQSSDESWSEQSSEEESSDGGMSDERHSEDEGDEKSD